MPANDTDPTSPEDSSHSKRMRGISSAHFLKLVEELGTIGFWSSDFATNQVATSSGINRLLGTDPAVPPAHLDVMEMMHPEDRPLNEDMRATLHSGQPIDREFRIIRRDGTLRWIRNKAEVILDVENRPVRAVGLMMDTTAEHEARRSVQYGWERYKTLISAIAAFEWKADEHGVVEYVSSWGDLTGQTRQQASGDGWLDAIHPDDRDATLTAWKLAVSSLSFYAVDHRICGTDGMYRHFQACGAPVFEPDGRVREWVGVLLKPGHRVSRFTPDVDTDRRGKPRLTAAQIRAARAMLNWSISDLADAAGVSVSSIRRLEGEMSGLVRLRVVHSVAHAFANSGMTFTFGRDKEEIGICLSLLKAGS